MNQKSQNRLAILRRWLDTWANSPRTNRSLVAEIIVEHFQACGLAEHIHGTGVEFSHSEDFSHDMRVHGQKIWRWLGAYEEAKPQPDKLWYIEQAIVAAMPEHIRIGYLGEVYQFAGVNIGIEQGGEAMNPAKLLQSLIKENSEAQMAVANLGPDITANERNEILRELRESAAATASAIAAIESNYTVQ